VKRVVRTTLQLVAGGGLTGLVAALSAGLNQQETAVVMAVMTLVVTFCQNYAEEAGWVRPVLK
jgi:tetrahydromethanopterin S-methyltransferase subunit D